MENTKKMTEAKILNLTPHDVSVIRDDGSITIYPASGVIARASVTSTPVGEVNGIQIVRSTFGAPEGLPDPEDGVMLVVSLATAKAARDYGRPTDDLLLTSSTVRDDQGRIIGCRCFGVL